MYEAPFRNTQFTTRRVSGKGRLTASPPRVIARMGARRTERPAHRDLRRNLLRARVLVSVAVAATIALGATGCEFMSPAGHRRRSGRSRDGVNVSRRQDRRPQRAAHLRHGEDARFVGTLVNTSADDITLAIELGSVAQTVEVPAQLARRPASSTSQRAESSVQSGRDPGHRRPVAATSSSPVRPRPGSLAKIYFQYSGAEGVSANVPVLTSALEEYNTLAPTPTPTPDLRAERDVDPDRRRHPTPAG